MFVVDFSQAAFIKSGTSTFLIEVFKPFTLNRIINMVGFKSTSLLLIFYLSLIHSVLILFSCQLNPEHFLNSIFSLYLVYELYFFVLVLWLLWVSQCASSTIRVHL